MIRDDARDWLRESREIMDRIDHSPCIQESEPVPILSVLCFLCGAVLIVAAVLSGLS